MFKEKIEMEFCYGEGIYKEGDFQVKGIITLGEHKLFLKDEEEELTRTYIPLDKIERMKMTSSGLEIYVCPSLTFRYSAVIKGNKAKLKELARDIAMGCGLKKRFLVNEWVEG